MNIIINGDDFGLHPEANKGIIHAFQHGTLTSASLMVNFESSLDAANLALMNPGLQVGLHFNISSGHCIAPKSEVAALVNEEGFFLFDSNDVSGSMRRLRTTILENHQVLEQVEREFLAQVGRFRSYGLEIAHIDIHHYLSLVHIDLFRKYVELANRISVPYRGICYPMIDMLHIPADIIKEMKIIIDHSISTSPDISLGNLVGSKPLVSPTIGEYQQTMEASLLSLAAEGKNIVELITHPANITDLVRKYDSYYWARKLETALVNSSTFKQFLDTNGFHLVRDMAIRNGKA